MTLYPVLKVHLANLSEQDTVAMILQSLFNPKLHEHAYFRKVFIIVQ